MPSGRTDTGSHATSPTELSSSVVGDRPGSPSILPGFPAMFNDTSSPNGSFSSTTRGGRGPPLIEADLVHDPAVPPGSLASVRSGTLDALEAAVAPLSAVNAHSESLQATSHPGVDSSSPKHQPGAAPSSPRTSASVHESPVGSPLGVPGPGLGLSRFGSANAGLMPRGSSRLGSLPPSPGGVGFVRPSLQEELGDWGATSPLITSPHHAGGSSSKGPTRRGSVASTDETRGVDAINEGDAIDNLAREWVNKFPFMGSPGGRGSGGSAVGSPTSRFAGGGSSDSLSRNAVALEGLAREFRLAREFLTSGGHKGSFSSPTSAGALPLFQSSSSEPHQQTMQRPAMDHPSGPRGDTHQQQHPAMQPLADLIHKKMKRTPHP